MDQDETTKKWRPVDIDVDGAVKSHWPKCEETMRQREEIQKIAQKQEEADIRARRRLEAKKREDNYRALVKGTPLERPTTDKPKVRTVKAADGFEDDLPWSAEA
jgi:hypothetical protein